MDLMKRRKNPVGLMDALKAAAADIPREMADMSEKQVVELVKAARRRSGKRNVAPRVRAVVDTNVICLGAAVGTCRPIGKPIPPDSPIR